MALSNTNGNSHVHGWMVIPATSTTLANTTAISAGIAVRLDMSFAICCRDCHNDLLRWLTSIVLGTSSYDYTARRCYHIGEYYCTYCTSMIHDASGHHWHTLWFIASLPYLGLYLTLNSIYFGGGIYFYAIFRWHILGLLRLAGLVTIVTIKLGFTHHHQVLWAVKHKWSLVVLFVRDIVCCSYDDVLCIYSFIAACRDP